MNFDEQTQPMGPDHQIPVGESSVHGPTEELAVLIAQVGMEGKFDLKYSKENLSWIFGRNAGTEWPFPAEKRRLSSKHFKIFATTDNPPTIMLQDLSTNGTFLNNVRVSKGRNCMVMNGDVITVGLGVPEDEIKFFVSIPKSSRAAPQGGVYDHYDFGELVGQGAFALVRQAVKRETGEKVAVKIIDKAKITGSVESAVEREIEILRQLVHENIVTLHDIFTDEKHYYLVMDYVPHGDLMEYLLNAQDPQKPGLPEAMCRDIIRQVLKAVEYVHLKGISHRDLKPDNILINSFDPVSVKVADFGLAKLQAQGTFLKTFCGTLSYLAPEVLATRNNSGGTGNTQTQSSLRRGNYNNLVDIWSIGCMAYVILTGCMPFGGNTQDELYKSTMAGNYFKEPLETSQVSEEAKDFIKYLLDIDNSTRPNAEQALQHPWLCESTDTQSLEYVKNNQPNLAHESTSSLSTRKFYSRVTNFSELNLQSMRPNQDVGADADADVDMMGDKPSPLDLESQNQLDEQPSSLHTSDVSDNDSPHTREMVDQIASQHKPVSQNFDVRDYGDEGGSESEVPSNAWAGLITLGSSIPCKDLYFTKPKFTIGRVVPGLFEETTPTIDFSFADKQISHLHCTFELVNNEEVYMYTYTNHVYVLQTTIKPNSKVRLYNGDVIILYAEFGNNTKMLGFKLEFINDFKPVQSKRPAGQKSRDKVPYEELPEPLGGKNQLKNTKRQRSEEFGPVAKKQQTFYKD